MAPIPEDNEEKPPSKEESDINAFSSFNTVATAATGSDSSDENEDSYPDNGYMLLPQEPGDDDDDDDDDGEDDFNNHNDHHNDINGNVDTITLNNHITESAPRRHHDFGTLENQDDSSIIPDNLPDDVLHSEAGASAPTVTPLSSSFHPEFLAKFPDGKVPAYMQVPAIQTNSKDLLWNKKRAEKNMTPLDSAQENKIMKAMSGFSLPSENIPEWARNMSDEQWNQHIIKQIQPVQNKLDGCQNQQKTEISSEKTQAEPEWVAEFPDP